MDFLRLMAVVLLATAVGCAPARLFSRSDPEDDFQLDPQDTRGPTLRNDAPASPATGNWNVVQDETATAPRPEPARSLHALPVAELLQRAEDARRQQRFPEARRHLEAIILQQPNHPDAHHRLAVIADLEGRFGDAEHHYKMALHSDSHNPSIIGDLGYSYMLQGRLPLAEQYLLKARSLDPAHARVAENLAHLYARRGDLSSAQQVLASALPPDEVEQRLAQLFPGVSLQQALQPQPPYDPATASATADRSPPSDAAYDGNFVSAPPANQAFATAPSATSAPDHRTAMVGAPRIAGHVSSSAPSTSPFASPQTGAGQPFAHAVPAAPINFDSEPQPLPQVEQAVVSGTTTAGTRAGERRWPPPLWPPESQAPVVQHTAGTVGSPLVTSDRPRSGVNYLLPRRAPITPAPLMPPVTPGSAPAANTPGTLPAEPAPLTGLPLADTARFHSPAQYSTGPGSSRIVTWSNLNGQSIDPPPLPPTDEELRAAAALGLGQGAPPPSAVMRTSPGTGAGWNGGYYPPPQRQLPGGTNVFAYPQQGAPIRAAAPPGPAASASPFDAMPHAGFVIAPDSAVPDNPLAGYDQDRRQFDEQFQQQVNQSYGQSPSGFIPPPSASIPAPTYGLHATGPQMHAAPPMTPNGTPWPGRTADNSLPGSMTAMAPSSQTTVGVNGASPAAAPAARVSRDLIAPPPYQRPQSSTLPTASPAPPSINTPLQLPTIFPGR